MNLLSRQPEPVPRLLEQTVQLYSASLQPVLPLALAAALAGAAPQLLMLALGSSDLEQIAAQQSGLFLLNTLLGVLVSLWMYAAMIVMLGRIATGQTCQVSEAAWQGLQRLLALLLGYLLYGLIVFIGLLLLIVPGVFLGIALYLFSFSIVLERQSAPGGINRAWELARGHWIHSFLIIMTPILAYLLAALLTGVLMTAIGAAWVGGLEAAAQGSDPRVLLLNTLASVVLATLFMPLLLAAGIVLFNDLILRHQGKAQPTGG